MLGGKKTVRKKNQGKNKGHGHKHDNKPAAPKKVRPINDAARAELQRLLNIQQNQYGIEGHREKLIKWANQVGSGKKESGQLDWRVRAGQATRNKHALRAGKTVQAELNPQISAAKNYESGLERLYANLAQQQQSNLGRIQSSNAAAKQNVLQGYDNLASSIAGNFRAGRENASAEANRLGINMNTDVSDATALENMYANLAGSGKAYAQTAMDMQSGGFDQLMGLLQGESANTGAGLRAASSQERGRLEASRPGKVYSLWQELEDAARTEAREQQQQDFLNRITKAKLSSETDLNRSQALGNLAGARKDIVDSRKPKVIRKKRITR